ncbi:MAG: 2OG-Fe dioxygenase family protein [Vicinamibacterales bacterium]
MNPEPAASAAAAAVTSLGRAGFARLAGREVQALAGTAADGFASLAASWADLDTDTYMADGGRYRRRRYASFAVDGAVVTRRPHQPHYQGRDYNRLNGGVDRWFTPIADAVAAHPLFERLVVLFGGMFDAAAAPRPWIVEAHQFRIEADPGHPGLPTPEGMHRDGVDWVAVCLIGRTNVAGGVTAVADAEGRSLGTFTLVDPLDTVVLDDHRLWHGVTPVMPERPGHPAHRDVLVLTYRDGHAG